MNPFVLGVAVGGLYVGDIIVTLLSFSILLFLLKRFAWGPLIKIMEEREQHVATELDSAEESRKRAEKSVKEADERLEKARAEAKEIVINAKQSATGLEEEIIREARSVAKKMKQDAEEEVEIERKEVLQEMQEEVAQIAFQIAMDIIQKEMSPEDQKRLIKERLNNIGDDWS
ncbi:F0F1 ATP synthase subunit B [Amphibacillus sp. MSJ-3]|uniref:F0F1 ATP synthase subunit B n=1 Tax=Amphibacillus sp. MSJ-3 TaxID=2841505 RepID=UPI001C0EE2ED|nr:F0F1 ATP synthase subunit B [Amphibacillus sp. MSJ-3]